MKTERVDLEADLALKLRMDVDVVRTAALKDSELKSAFKRAARAEFFHKYIEAPALLAFGIGLPAALLTKSSVAMVVMMAGMLIGMGGRQFFNSADVRNDIHSRAANNALAERLRQQQPPQHNRFN